MVKAHSSNASSSMRRKAFLDINELLNQHTTFDKPWLTKHTPEVDWRGHLVVLENEDKRKHLVKSPIMSRKTFSWRLRSKACCWQDCIIVSISITETSHTS